jgi:hypothetical protein
MSLANFGMLRLQWLLSNRCGNPILHICGRPGLIVGVHSCLEIHASSTVHCKEPLNYIFSSVQKHLHNLQQDLPSILVSSGNTMQLTMNIFWVSHEHHASVDACIIR